MALSVSPSYWESKTFLQHQDVIVIGGGIVGLTAALSMRDKDGIKNVTILERGPIPMGASTRNAGFACFGSLSELIADRKASSTIEDIKNIVAMRKSGLDLLRLRVPDQEMDYVASGGYEYFSAAQTDEFEECRDLIEEYNSIVEDATGLSDTYQLSNETQFGFTSPHPLIYNQHEGQLNPAKLIKYLVKTAKAKGVTIINGAEVQDIEESADSINAILTSGHRFSASKLVHTTNAFVKDLTHVPDVNAVRNQVYVTEEIPKLSLAGCFHSQQGYIYFRNIDNRILIGGARQHFNTEDTDDFGQTVDIKNYLHQFLIRELGLPESIQFDHAWSGILAVGSSKKPLIQQISNRQFIGVRMGGMGVAIGSLVGAELANLTFP